MKRLGKLFFITALSFSFGSCEKKELPAPKHAPGNTINAAVDMGPTYKWQVYFSLRNNKEVGKNLKTAWDVGFETTPEGYHVTLNMSKSMFAMNTNKTDFSTVTLADTSGFYEHRQWDAPSGDLDSTAIGDWRNKQNVYIVDLGFNELGQALGFKKIQLLSVNDSDYTFRAGDLSSMALTTISIKKDSTYNFCYASLSAGQAVTGIEPPKKDWDIVFTQYTHIFHDPFTPYLVTGCLLNRYHTMAYSDTLLNFNNINSSNLRSADFSDAINVIGYDWKTFTGSQYVTNSKISYIIRDQFGQDYKLHFIDFYSASGIKGSPKWEYQQL